MKTLLAYIILAALLFPAVAVAETAYLFIGNSQTETGNLPAKFDSLATAGGHDVYVDRITVSSSTLGYHSRYQPTQDLIHSRTWDNVILQEHSLLPVIPYWMQESFYPSAARLDSIVTASGSGTTLFQHWAHPHPSGVYCVSDHCSREFEDYFDMQAEMSSAFSPLAVQLDVPLVRVGDVWASALRVEPDLPLWDVDQLHASPDGAYLSACVFYVTLFDESPVGLPYHASLDPVVAEHYQQIAFDAVAGNGVTVPAVRVRRLSNHPNPFNPTTEVRFEVLRRTVVALTVFDAAGRRVRELDPGTQREPGVQRIEWDGRDDGGSGVPAGVYLLRLEAGSEHLSSKLTLVR